MEFDIKLNYKNKGWLSFEIKNLWIIILSDENCNCFQLFNASKWHTDLPTVKPIFIRKIYTVRNFKESSPVIYFIL